MDAAAIEALADAWASIDGKSAAREACRRDHTLEDELGYFGGYEADAEELLTRLYARGFKLVKIQ